MDSGYEFRSTTDSEVICHMIIDEYNKTKDAINAIQNTCQKLIGSYSFVAVINGVLYAVRDPLGMKPLSLGRSEDFVVVASETVAFDSLDIKYERSIEPGEILDFIIILPFLREEAIVGFQKKDIKKAIYYGDKWKNRK